MGDRRLDESVEKGNFVTKIFFKIITGMKFQKVVKMISADV